MTDQTNGADAGEAERQAQHMQLVRDSMITHLRRQRDQLELQAVELSVQVNHLTAENRSLRRELEALREAPADARPKAKGRPAEPARAN